MRNGLQEIRKIIFRFQYNMKTKIVKDSQGIAVENVNHSFNFPIQNKTHFRI